MNASSCSRKEGGVAWKALCRRVFPGDRARIMAACDHSLSMCCRHHTLCPPPSLGDGDAPPYLVRSVRYDPTSTRAGSRVRTGTYLPGEVCVRSLHGDGQTGSSCGWSICICQCTATSRQMLYNKQRAARSSNLEMSSTYMDDRSISNSLCHCRRCRQKKKVCGIVVVLLMGLTDMRYVWRTDASARCTYDGRTYLLGRHGTCNRTWWEEDLGRTQLVRMTWSREITRLGDARSCWYGTMMTVELEVCEVAAVRALRRRRARGVCLWPEQDSRRHFSRDCRAPSRHGTDGIVPIPMRGDGGVKVGAWWVKKKDV
jgi:hypothetical protein